MKKLMLHLLSFAFLLFAFEFTSAQIPTYMPTNGLVAWYPFNGNANDESGNGNHGTVNGTTLRTDRFGNSGKAYAFDGWSNFISFENAPFINYPFTISVWIKLNSIDNHPILSLGEFGADNLKKFYLGPTYGAIGTPSIGTGGANDITSTSNVITAENWTNLVVCVNSYSTTGVVFYINGIAYTVNTIGGSNFPFPLNNTGFVMGKHAGTGWYSFFNGSLDDIAFYNRALTSQEITALYQGSSTNNGTGSSVGINTTTPHASAALEIKDSTRGLLIPRMTSSQRNNITNPAEGLMVYQTNDSIGFWYYGGQKWLQINSKGIKGDQGEQGEQGLQGLRGDSGISVRNTIVSGDSFYITLSNGQNIRAGNVRGLTGAEGATGPAGAQGIQGPQGEQGIQGLQGVKGDSGISIRNSFVTGDSLFVTLSNGRTLNAGHVRGATGYLQNGTSAGNTPYWNGTTWVTNSSNIYNNGGNVGIKTATPNASAVLEIKDSTRGILIPRMTMVQRNAIQNPAEGLMVYQTDSSKGYWYWDNIGWSLLSNKYSTELSINSRLNKTLIGFDSSATWTCPIGVNYITVELWGGGGGGGAGSDAGNGIGAYTSQIGSYTYSGAYGGDGGKGGYFKTTIQVSPGSIYQIIVGKGGNGGSLNGYNGGNGSPGNVSSFSNIIFAQGGLGGSGGRSFGGGATNGTTGSNAQVINYNYPSIVSGSRSYIPTNLLPSNPGSTSNGGSGGIGGRMVATSSYTNHYDVYPGTKGENGYCIIYY